MHVKAVIFDLDGVVVDTAKYHYLAWKAIADRENISFNKEINEGLKGVSRMECANILAGRSSKVYKESEISAIAEEKNQIYLQMIMDITPDSYLPGIKNFIHDLRSNNIKTALCSASRNTSRIIDRLEAADLFDVVVSGNDVSNSKPHPEAMLLTSERLAVKPCDCVVIEDAVAGVQAAKEAGMKTIGIGDKKTLREADIILHNTASLEFDVIRSFEHFN